MPRFKEFRCQAENIQGGEAEDNCPENVVDVPAGTAVWQGENKTENNRSLAAHNGIGRHRCPGSPGKARKQRHCRRHRHNHRQSTGKSVPCSKPKLGYYPFFCRGGNLVSSRVNSSFPTRVSSRFLTV